MNKGAFQMKGINNLTVGQEFKSYKDLCETIGWKYKNGGRSAKTQKERISKYLILEKKGFKLKIIEILEQPPRKEPKSRKNSIRHKEFKVSKKDWYSIGVYRIINYKTNEVYIGSTIDGFRKRFLRHKTGVKNQQHTYELLQNGAVFEIIEVMDNSSELEIRAKEQEYINQYKDSQEYILINKYKETVCLKEPKPKKPHYINIKVLDIEYEEIVQLLQDNGLLENCIITTKDKHTA